MRITKNDQSIITCKYLSHLLRADVEPVVELFVVSFSAIEQYHELVNICVVSYKAFR